LSRRPGLLIAALLHSALLAAPLAAQDAPAATAEQVLAAGKKAYTLPDRRDPAECAAPRPGTEIVVCGREDDQGAYRAESSSDLDPTGAGARDTIPRAPNVETVYPGSVVGRFGKPPPMPVLIDLKAIPEPPPGSDADLIARGERPQ
jgi:hypothetical protein